MERNGWDKGDKKLDKNSRNLMHAIILNILRLLNSEVDYFMKSYHIRL